MTYRNTIKNIEKVRRTFENQLEKNLNLSKVSGPLIVDSAEKINDYLNGEDKPVVFNTRYYDMNIEIVQSLAKWKRQALSKYGFELNEGIYTNMKAIRPNEKLSNIHSFYVDQWDWEYIIDKKDRTRAFLEQFVNRIYNCILNTIALLKNEIALEQSLPNELKFVTTQELEDMYPNLTASEREREIASKYKAVFLIGIGHKLKQGKNHDDRAPDYDDWNLNGDLLLWSSLCNQVFEISSMGIRVDRDSLVEQLAIKKQQPNSMFHHQVMNESLPFTIGGGIGQSRLIMYLLSKKHIAEVQNSVWSSADISHFALHKIKNL